MTEKVLEFTDALCSRPAIYVGRHSYREVVAFLLGYASGLTAAASAWKMEPLIALSERIQQVIPYAHGSNVHECLFRS